MAIKRCVICGKEFEVFTPEKCCSDECRKIRARISNRERAQRRRKKNPEEMRRINRKSYAKHIKKRRAEKKKYRQENAEKCRLSALQRDTRKRIRERLETGRYFCAICGKFFEPKYFGQKYCSDECRNSRQAKMMRIFFTKIFNRLI